MIEFCFFDGHSFACIVGYCLKRRFSSVAVLWWDANIGRFCML